MIYCIGMNTAAKRGGVTFGYTVVNGFKITVGALSAAFAFYNFIIPIGIIPGGFSGVAAVAELASGGVFSASIVSIVLNVPFFALSYRTMNKRFFWFSLYGMLVYSLGLELIKQFFIFDMGFSGGSRDILMALAGGIISGAGLGYIARIGFSTGGSDLLAAMVNKTFPVIKFSAVINAFKVFNIVLYTVVLGTTVENILLSFVVMYVSGYVTDALIDGFKAAKAFYIITEKTHGLSAAIMDELDRTSTVFAGEGARLRGEQRMLMCIVNNHQVAKLRGIVYRVDPKAFMFSVSVKEAYGTGFAENKPLPKILHPAANTPHKKNPKDAGDEKHTETLSPSEAESVITEHAEANRRGKE